MARPWQFRLSTLLIAMVALSIATALVARFGADGVILLLLGGGLLVAGIGVKRRSIGLVAAGLLGSIAVLATTGVPGNAVWDGRKTVPLRFTLIDAATGKPIPGATVRLRHNDSLEQLTRGRPGQTTVSTTTPELKGSLARIDKAHPDDGAVSATTASDGSATLYWEFLAGGREGGGFILFGDYENWIEVSAPGYAVQLAPLNLLIGKSRDISDPIPPPVTLSLVPDAADAASHSPAH